MGRVWCGGYGAPLGLAAGPAWLLPGWAAGPSSAGSSPAARRLARLIYEETDAEGQRSYTVN